MSEDFLVHLESFCNYLPVTYVLFVAYYSQTLYYQLISLKCLIIRKIIEKKVFDRYDKKKHFKNTSKIDPLPNSEQELQNLEKEFESVMDDLDYSNLINTRVLLKFVRIVEQIEETEESDGGVFHFFQRLLKTVPAICTYIGQSVIVPIAKKNADESQKLKCNCTINGDTEVNATSTLDQFNKTALIAGQIGVSCLLTFLFEFFRVFIKNTKSCKLEKLKVGWKKSSFYSFIVATKVTFNWNFATFVNYIKLTVLTYILPPCLFPLISVGFKYGADAVRISQYEDVKDKIFIEQQTLPTDNHDSIDENDTQEIIPET